jgi:OsmC-like protein
MPEQSSFVEERQRPLRALYREHPEEGITVKHVRSVQDESTDQLHGTVLPVDFPGIQWRYGTDRKVGGDDDLPNSGHVLVASLAMCMDSMLRMIADLMHIEIVDLEVDVVGDVDVRGVLAMDPNVRPGFRSIRTTVQLTVAPGTPSRMVEMLTGRAEQLSVCLDTIRNGAPVAVAVDVRHGESAEAGSTTPDQA